MFAIGQKVKVIQGELQGYYGTILNVYEGSALVTHNAEFAGYMVRVEELALDE